MKSEITKRTKVNRLPKRAAYDKDVIYRILDSTFICNIGFVIDGQPFVIPTSYGRKENKIFFHGSSASRMLKHIRTGSEICVTVMKIDGIVLARSAFHHSINYRSVVIFGKAEEIIDQDEKINALQVISEQIIPGRWKEVRKPNQKELNATMVFSLQLDEASAKIREGGPSDDKEDMELNIWAGVLPVNTVIGSPKKAEDLSPGIPVPDYLINYNTTY